MSNKQSQVQGSGSGDNSDDDDVQAAGQVQINTTGTDDLLDEIDGLLESNAEEYVSSYVQKGRSVRAHEFPETKIPGLCPPYHGHRNRIWHHGFSRAPSAPAHTR